MTRPVRKRIEIVADDQQMIDTPSIEGVLQGPIVRSLHMQGDTVQLLVKASVWNALHSGGPGNWETGDGARRTLRVTEIDHEDTETVVLDLPGYVERDVRPVQFGAPLDGGDADPTMLLVTLETWSGYFRDGRGGSLTDRTFNPVGADGRVIAPVPGNDSRTAGDLIQILLAFQEVAFDSIPATIDDAPLPGPLDFGNARIVPELEGLLARAGHAMCPVLDTDNKVRIVRLPKAGETLTLPTSITDHADPYELTSAPALRATKLAITSGRQRSIIVRTITLADLEFVAFDERTNAWLNLAEWIALYPAENGPVGLAAFKAGPGDTAASRAAHSKLYTALRIANIGARARMSRMVPIPPGTTLASGEEAAGVPAVVFAHHAMPLQGGQWRNDPDDAMDPAARLDGVRVDPFAGVFLMPKPMLRVSGGPEGSTDTLAELAGGDLTILFAHEANEVDETPAGLVPFELNYFARAYMSDDAGVVTPCGEVEIPLVPTGSGQDAVDALHDTMTVHLQDESLREVWVWEDGDAEPTSVNGDTLAAIAAQHAAIRASAPNAQSGTIRLRGIHAIAPGDAGGAVTQVSWDPITRQTFVRLNQHEEPLSTYEALERQAGRSIAAGLSRFRFAGSSAGESDLREGSSPFLGAGFFPADPGPADRGREVTKVAETIKTPPLEREALRPPRSRFGRITAQSVIGSVGDNRWLYTVRLGHLADDKTFVDGTTDVAAINMREIGNSSTGVQGNGIDVANLNGFMLKPIAGVVELLGDYGAPGDRFALFNEYNAVDGSCE